MYTHKIVLVLVTTLLFFGDVVYIYHEQIVSFVGKEQYFSKESSTPLAKNSQDTGFAAGGIPVNNEFYSVDTIESSTTTMIFVGDIMLSRAIGSIMVKKNDWSYPFLHMGDYLQDADLTFGNLEGPISDRGTRVGSIYSFRADPRVVEGLTFAGFDVVSVANNHMWDYSRDAYNDTLSILEKNDIGHAGGGNDFTQAHTAIVKDMNGTKVAFLAYTNLLPQFLGKIDAKPSVAFPDEAQMVSDIALAKRRADIVVVSFHFGDEYATTHNAYQENIAHAAVDAGASLVVGHHPHVVEDVEQYKGVYILYSLGNFVFDQNFSDDTKRGLIAEVAVKNKKIVNLTTREINFTSTYQPFLKDK
jgi:poly-gamma-glutamate synthesis protein (capsule biosynthesis protein)